jgi:hypothetical protein
MVSNDEDTQKRELAQGFLHFLIDGAAGKTPAGGMPTLADSISERVSHDTRQQVADLLPQYLDKVLPGLVDQAVARRTGSGDAQSAFGRYGMIALIACAVLAVTCLMLVALYIMKPNTAAVADSDPPSVADDAVLPAEPSSVSVSASR